VSSIVYLMEADLIELIVNSESEQVGGTAVVTREIFGLSAFLVTTAVASIAE